MGSSISQVEDLLFMHFFILSTLQSSRLIVSLFFFFLMSEFWVTLNINISKNSVIYFFYK